MHFTKIERVETSHIYVERRLFTSEAECLFATCFSFKNGLPLKNYNKRGP